MASIRLIKDNNEDEAARAVFIKVGEKLNEQLLLETPAKAEKVQAPSIYKIPAFMRGGDQSEALEPLLVSFGPYHHENDRCKSMEKQKLAALRIFASHSEKSVECIVKRVWVMLEELQGSYDELDSTWNEKPEEFLRLMVLDGCFMLEVMMDDNDCPLKKMVADIRRDMLLLENQLPMKLLEELHSMANHSGCQNVKSLVCKFMRIPEKVQGELSRNYSHVLEMYMDTLLIPRQDKIRSGSENEIESQIIRPATQLREAGIRFKPSDTKCVVDVSFEGGVLMLPKMQLDDDTESALLNVIAFEKLHREAGSNVTSFIALMDSLIDVEQDVALLASKNIIVNALGNDQDAADLFGRLGKGAAVSLGSHIIDVQAEVNKHCNRKWNEWCASLKHNYFQHPWAVVSLIAASLGFAILILQAVYQICDYY